MSYIRIRGLDKNDHMSGVPRAGIWGDVALSVSEQLIEVNLVLHSGHEFSVLLHANTQS
jgi:hypothetical protein